MSEQVYGERRRRREAERAEQEAALRELQAAQEKAAPVSRRELRSTAAPGGRAPTPGTDDEPHGSRHETRTSVSQTLAPVSPIQPVSRPMHTARQVPAQPRSAASAPEGSRTPPARPAAPPARTRAPIAWMPADTPVTPRATPTRPVDPPTVARPGSERPAFPGTTPAGGGGYRAPAPGYRAPAPGYRAPAPGYRAPAPGYDASATAAQRAVRSAPRPVVPSEVQETGGAAASSREPSSSSPTGVPPTGITPTSDVPTGATPTRVPSAGATPLRVSAAAPRGRSRSTQSWGDLIQGAPPVLPTVEAGQAARRSPQQPHVPAVGESLIPGFGAVPLVASLGTPSAPAPLTPPAIPTVSRVVPTVPGQVPGTASWSVLGGRSAQPSGADDGPPVGAPMLGGGTVAPIAIAERPDLSLEDEDEWLPRSYSWVQLVVLLGCAVLLGALVYLLIHGGASTSASAAANIVLVPAVLRRGRGPRLSRTSGGRFYKLGEL